MNSAWRSILHSIVDRSKAVVAALLEEELPEPKAMPELSEVVEQARQEWLGAQNYYNSVCDTDLVDHAVYMMQAAEKKYMYLLKRAREEGVTYSPYLPGTEGKGQES